MTYIIHKDGKTRPIVADDVRIHNGEWLFYRDGLLVWWELARLVEVTAANRQEINNGS